MKRIVYIAALASILMTACQKTDVLNVAEDAIEFGTHIGKLTKAGTDYSADKYATLLAQDFRVWAYSEFESGKIHKGTIYNGLENKTVSDKEEGAVWSIDDTKTYFWPQRGNYLSFYTISAAHKDWLDAISFESQPTGETSFDEFEVDDANDDVMVSNVIKQDKSNKTVVPFFRHTMTKVEFNFRKGADDSQTDAEEASVIILKGITTDKLAYKGNLTVTYGDNFNFTWTPTTEAKAFSGIPTDFVTIVKAGGAIVEELTTAPEGPSAEVGVMGMVISEDAKTREIYYTEEIEGENGTKKLEMSMEKHTLGASGWASDATTSKFETFAGCVIKVGTTDKPYDNFVTWYMVPQTIELKQPASDAEEGKGRVRIDYVADGRPLHQYFALTGTAVPAWEEERCVKYNVTIAPHKVQFNPSVDAWKPYGYTEANQGGSDINMDN